MAFQTLAFQFLLFSFFLAASLTVRAQGYGSMADRPRPRLEPRSPFLCPSYIYAFGNSYTDTGNLQAITTTELNYPYGESYCFPYRPKERTRYCNGRIVIDFITQAFKFPFIEPYKRHFDDEAYKRGVNFAISTGTATTVYSLPGTGFHLERETTDYLEFRAKHTGPLYDAPSALYILPEIGGNDFVYAFSIGQTPEVVVETVVPAVLEAIKVNIEQYYARGARNIAIFNIPPAGCTSLFLTIFAGRSPYDEFGCLLNYNKAIQAYNLQLSATVYNYREKWPDANLFLFEFFDATYEVIKNPEKYGFRKEILTKACCGCCGPYNYNPLLPCGKAGYVPDPDNGPDIFIDNTKACSNPEHHIIWDGEHSTEAFYRVVAGFFLTGQFVDGPREYSNWKQLCNLDFSQWGDDHHRNDSLCNDFDHNLSASAPPPFDNDINCTR